MFKTKKIKETDVKDPHGTVVISPGLKVRHKDSQYEYTVDGVTQDGSEEIQIILRLPDEPRFEPDTPSADIIQAKSEKNSNLMYEIDPNTMYYEPANEESEEPELISVSQEEFEQEYEVK